MADRTRRQSLVVRLAIIIVVSVLISLLAVITVFYQTLVYIENGDLSSK